MKHGIFLMLTVCINMAFGSSQTVDLVYDNAAVLNFCQPKMFGCAERISVDGKSYLLDALMSAQGTVTALRAAYAFNKIYQSLPGKAVGFVVSEKGHFPNPMAEFEVFKLLDANFSSPK